MSCDFTVGGGFFLRNEIQMGCRLKLPVSDIAPC